MLSVLIPNALEENVEEFVEMVERELPVGQIIVATDRHRRGKGYAIREALQHATGDWVAFLDADGDIEPRMLKRLIPFLEDYDIVLASKTLHDSPFSRKIVTHVSRLFIRVVLGLPWDTQTGLKLFRREALPEWKTDGFSFDTEILRKALKNKAKIIEIPIEVSIREGVKASRIWKMFLEIIRIRFSV